MRRGQERVTLNALISCPLRRGPPSGEEILKALAGVAPPEPWIRQFGNAEASIYPGFGQVGVITYHLNEPRDDQFHHIHGLRLAAWANTSKFTHGAIAILIGNKPMWSTPIWNTSPDWMLWSEQISGSARRRIRNMPYSVDPHVYSYICRPRLPVSPRQNLTVIVEGIELGAPGAPESLDLCLIGTSTRDIC